MANAVLVESIYARIQTVPGGAHTATFTITDGVTAVTVTFGAADNDAANAAVDQEYVSGTQFDFDTTNAGAAADLNAVVTFVEL